MKAAGIAGATAPDFQAINPLQGKLVPIRGDNWGGSRQTGVHWLPPGERVRIVAGRSLSTRVDVSADAVQEALQKLLSPWMALDHRCVIRAFGYIEEESDIRVLTAWQGVKPSLEDCLTPDWSREEAENLKYLWGDDRRQGLLQLMRDAAEGLAYIHSMNLDHGNMHLKNIILMGKDRRRAAITDIGYAGFRRAVSDQRTVTYQPFEQLAQVRLGPKQRQPGDVFAFGCTLVKAFARDWEWNVIQVVNGSIPSSNEVPQIHAQDSIWDLIGLTFQKEKISRPSMHDVVSRLEDAIKNPPEIAFTAPTFSSDPVDADVDVEDDKLSDLIVHGFISREGERMVGGYSTVMRARWTRIGAPPRIVAAKNPFSPTRPSLTPEEKRNRLYHRAYREARVWSRLNHVNIVEFLGILFQSEGGDEREPYLLSPWMRLGSLAEYLARKQDANRLDLVIQVTEGVRYLHQEGIWHGDLKCQNVLVQENQEAGGDSVIAKLCDFGLSQVILEDFPMTSTVGMGTSGFRPPELQDRSDKKSLSLDIFSLGGLILEAFTGKAPFYKLANAEKIRKCQETGQFPQFSDHQALSKTSPVWALMHKCWHQRPQDRPTSEQVLAELRSLQASGSWLGNESPSVAV